MRDDGRDDQPTKVVLTQPVGRVSNATELVGRGEMPKGARDMYRKSHERCLTSSGPAFGLPRILCEGVEPWGAAVLRPSRRRWPGS